jgi:hypothetical protein
MFNTSPAKEKGMTRKDFELIATVVKTIDDDATRNATALNFGVLLRRTNDRFNLVRFVEACNAKANMMAVADATDRMT